MSEIAALSNSGASTQTTEIVDPSQEIQDSFLTMLMAQLQNQDPLNPMENTEFTAQLAQINTVEQLQGVNQNLGYLQLYMASMNNSQAIGFIGKEVLASGDSVYFDGYNQQDINYRLQGNASQVAVTVYDTSGRLVRTLHAGAQASGPQQITWDGRDGNGNLMAEGTYSFKIMATDVSGGTVGSTRMLTGVVDGVTFQDGITYVTVNGQKIPIGDIVEIRDRDYDATTQASLDLIGRHAVARCDTMLYDGSGGQVLQYSITGDADSVLIDIYDDTGTVVRTIDQGVRDAGRQQVSWDGTDDSGTLMPAGTYSFTVRASAADGSTITANSLISGTIDSIAYDEDGNPFAEIAGTRVPVEDIIELDEDSGVLNMIAGALGSAGKLALRMAPMLL